MPFTIPNENVAASVAQAAPDSGDFDVLVAAHAGTGVIAGCAVTAQGTPDMTVAISGGTVLIDNDQVSVTGTNAVIAAADGTNPRFDLIAVGATGTVIAVAGTATASPVFPAVPAESVVLAAVHVIAGATSISSARITDKRVIVIAAATSDHDHTDPAIAARPGQPLTQAVAPWVKPSGTGAVTTDPQGKITIDNGAGYKFLPGAAFLDGRLHLVYAHGPTHNGVGQVIKYRYSDNLGRTWSTAVTLASGGASVKYSDPSITALASGRLLVGYDDSGGFGQFTDHVTVIYSDDKGQTWSAPYAVPVTGMDYECAGTSQMLELADGSILLPAYGLNTAISKYFCVVFKSTDGGLTFPTQITMADSGEVKNYTEPQIRLLASGEIVGLMRSDDLPIRMWRTVSTNGGTTWSTPTDVITLGGRPDFVEFYPGALLLFGRNTGNLAPRWAVSWDKGVTWTVLQADAGEVTTHQLYAAPVVLAPGLVVVPYAVENSSTSADLFLRYYFNGYGTDVLGNVRTPWVELDEQTAPATPPPGKGVLYAGTDSLPYFKNDSGTAYPLGVSAELDYAQVTTDSNITATSEATAITIITGSGVTYAASTVVVIEFFSPISRPAGSANATLNFYLYQDGVSLGIFGVMSTPSAANTYQPVLLRRRMTPTAGAHTYSVRASVSSGTGIVGAGAGGAAAYVPAFIRITRA